ncbi:MAG: hypothetical protein D6726_10260 [Nitrospirae bacterium]|nr:MAG: hypothetical protein D6726_10260 [Nitrospirota bacterium]
MKITRVVLLGSVILAILFFIFPFHRESGIISPQVTGSFMEDLVINQFSQKGLNWYARVKRASLDEKKGMVYLKSVTFRYPDRDFKLFSEKGRYSINKGELTFTAPVSGRSEKIQFTSGELSYDTEKGIVHALKGVHIRGDRFEVKGRSARINKEDRIEIEGDIHARFF